MILSRMSPSINILIGLFLVAIRNTNSHGNRLVLKIFRSEGFKPSSAMATENTKEC